MLGYCLTYPLYITDHSVTPQDMILITLTHTMNDSENGETSSEQKESVW